MRENNLLRLVELFALIGDYSEEYQKLRRVYVEAFLKRTIEDARADEMLVIYDQIIDSSLDITNRKSRIASICHELESNITQRQKANAVLRLLEFVFVAKKASDFEAEMLTMSSTFLNIALDEFNLLEGIVTLSDRILSLNTLVISANEKPDLDRYKHIFRPKLVGTIYIIYLKSADLFFTRYVGKGDVKLNGVLMKQGRVYVYGSGAIIRGALMKPVYSTNVVSQFIAKSNRPKIQFNVENITYQFSDGTTGLHELSFCESTGNLMGIMGSSGSGKTTLLNVLSGSARPTSGRITVNGIDLYDQRKELKGVVGFVSQDDLLIEDLTVYQNLYYNAQLSFAGKSDEFIRNKVNRVAKRLGLQDIAHLKVGNPLDKIISGGQRKRLNIALEVIREPAVLFLDEPTSGLSSKDSETIIDLLKSLAIRGTLVFVVIHQPSSQIYKAFDKMLILDQGGYAVFMGNPIDAVIYFKHATKQINPNMGECFFCGNVNPEQIFSIMEVRQLDENGFPTGERKITPQQWNDYFIAERAKEDAQEIILPASDYKNDYRIPNKLKQFQVFIKRDVLAKINNRQYLFITLLEAPVLALLLSFLTRYQAPEAAYSFQGNRNMVAYIFLSVIVALFLGLMTSAEEILVDRKIRKRERFLNLSRASYLGSKFAILACISALQALLFVGVGNSIMGFRELYFEFWLMFFALSLYANALGLNVSSAFKSAVTIYIVIPFLIIPQLMLSGLLVKFEELNPAMSARSVVPISGDLMATRWAFEGLAVALYTQNEYKEPVYDLEAEKINLTFYRTTWYYKMSELLTLAAESKSDSLYPLLQKEFAKQGLSENLISAEMLQNGEAKRQLDRLRKTLNQQYDQVLLTLDEQIILTAENAGVKDYEELRHYYFNDRLEDLVRNRDVLSDKIYIENGELHPGSNSIYFNPPQGQFIRAQLFAPHKFVFGGYVDTFWVNVMIILLMAILLHFVLYYRVLEFTIARLENLKLAAKFSKK